jgi:hypothetical protein
MLPRWNLFATVLSGLLIVGPTALCAAELKITINEQVSSYSSSDLLGRPEVADLTIPNDVAYKRRMVYKAIPLLVLLGSTKKLSFDTLEARAADGFVSQLPMNLVMRGASGGATPWIAVEAPQEPWPKINKKTISAGPFYLVWQFPEKAALVRSSGPTHLPSCVVSARRCSVGQKWSFSQKQRRTAWPTRVRQALSSLP